MYGKNNILAPIFVGVIISCCGIGAVAEAARRNLAGNQNPGFINIDCGATDEYFDDTYQLWFQPDSRYIDSGENMEVSPEFRDNVGDLFLMNLRSFPNGVRNCYTLRPDKGENQTYLIRAFFMYGNYDGKNQIPVFDLHIGVNKWATVQLGSISNFHYEEINIVPPNGDVQVCLINSGHGTPFITFLELAILENALYQPSPGALQLRGRYNAGAQLQLTFW